MFIYSDSNGEFEHNWKTISANINGESHFTADVRKIKEEYWAVFSDITKEGRLEDSTMSCVEVGLYIRHPITFKSVHEDHFIWVKVDLSAFANRKGF